MASVFTTPDGTPTAPASEVVTDAGLSFGSQVNPGKGTPVFASQGVVQTPANVSGWTVQNAATGSDQNLVKE